MTDKVPVTVYFSPKQFKKLTTLAASKLMQPPEYIRQHIASSGIPAYDPVEVDLSNKDTVKLGISLPKFIIDAVSDRAKALEMAKSRYIGALIQSQVTAMPVFTDTELAALVKCNDQLWKIGININQLARHFNEARLAGNVSSFDPIKYDVFLSLKKELKQSRQAIRELIRASRGVWGVK